MKLPHHRALALLGLLTLAGLLIPREGATIRILGRDPDQVGPRVTLGDPEGPDTKGRNMIHGGGLDLEGRILIARKIYLAFKSSLSRHANRR